MKIRKPDWLNTKDRKVMYGIQRQTEPRSRWMHLCEGAVVIEDGGPVLKLPPPTPPHARIGYARHTSGAEIRSAQTRSLPHPPGAPLCRRLTLFDKHVSLSIMNAGIDTMGKERLNEAVRVVRVRALRLLDQQLWCLGRDVCAEGNLLLRYNFTRRRPPDPAGGGSEYVWRDDASGACVTLWGYGVHLAAAGEAGLFLKRYAFAPRWTPPNWAPCSRFHVSAWKKARGPRTTEEADALLRRLIELSHWFAHYEAWIAEVCPATYRADCLSQWHREAITPPDRIAKEWARLSNHFISFTNI